MPPNIDQLTAALTDCGSLKQSRTIIPPIVFGNTVVLKRSEFAPIAAGLIHAEIFDEAGWPPGVLNVIAHAFGAATPIADEFFENPAVRAINFTGSTRVGRLLAERAGCHLKRIVLELGGYNPLIVLDDADLDYAVDAAAFGAFMHQGQVCMNARKVIVQQGVHDEFVEKLREKTAAIKVGDPRKSDTIIGLRAREWGVGHRRGRCRRLSSRGSFRARRPVRRWRRVRLRA